MSFNFSTLFFEDFYNLKWTAPGQSRTITWSTVDDVIDLAFPNGAQLQVAASSIPYLPIYAQAFALWDAALESVSFVQTTGGNAADITLAIAQIDGPGGIAGRWGSTWSAGIVIKSTIHFDPADIGSGDLLTTALHEIGNVLGLGDIHPTESLRSVQEDPFPEIFSGSTLWQDDIDLIQAYYGETGGVQPGLGPGSDDDTIMMVAGNETIDGLAGIDTAVFGTASTNISIAVTSTGAIMTIDRNGTGGTDSLVNVEVLQFTDRSINLENYSSAVELSQAQFTELTEMYVAYFNRAADAEGLYFWADKFAEGMSLNQIAEYFFDQVETRALYPNPQDTDAFVTAVYANVLGRTPDPAGFSFWAGQLSDGNISQGALVLEIIKGAKAGGDPGDVVYLAAKAEIGLYFSAIKGLSDPTDATQVMQVFGDQATSNTAGAKIAADNHFSDATEPGGGELLLPLVGVVDDPFAGFV